jgi:hypothetical protein
MQLSLVGLRFVATDLETNAARECRCRCIPSRARKQVSIRDGPPVSLIASSATGAVLGRGDAATVDQE